MYEITNRKEAIKVIQEALFKLGYGESHLVSIDGIWGENTRCAVLHFQRENDLLVTGVVDFETFAKLMERSNEKVQKVNMSPFPLKEGDANGRVEHLHALLNILFSEHQKEHISYLKGSLFSEKTKQFVSRFKNRIGDTPNGEITAHQFERLQRECDCILLMHK